MSSDGFDKKQLQLVTWAQTGILVLAMSIITWLAGSWAASMKADAAEMKGDIKGIRAELAANAVVNASQQKDLDAHAAAISEARGSIIRLWQVRSARSENNGNNPTNYGP